MNSNLQPNMLSAIGKLCPVLLLFGLVASKSVTNFELDETMLRGDEDDEGGFLTPEDFENVGNRTNEDADHDEDGNPDYFEGDVVNGNEEDRDAEFNKKWPMRNGKVYIPYTIPSNFPSANRAQVANAIAEYEQKTCVR